MDLSWWISPDLMRLLSSVSAGSSRPSSSRGSQGGGTSLLEMRALVVSIVIGINMPTAHIYICVYTHVSCMYIYILPYYSILYICMYFYTPMDHDGSSMVNSYTSDSHFAVKRFWCWWPRIYGRDQEPTLWLCQNSYWKWQCIVDFPTKNGDSVKTAAVKHPYHHV